MPYWIKNGMRKRISKKVRPGFSLTELLVVMAVAAILVQLGVSAYLSAQKKGRDAKRKADLAKTADTLEMYLNDNAVYPNALGGLIEGCAAGACEWGAPFVAANGTLYSAKLPTDPLKSQQYAYEAVGKGYRLYSRLENIKDSSVPVFSEYNINCGAAMEQTVNCNYVISSENVSAPTSYVPAGPSGPSGPAGPSGPILPPTIAPPECTASCISAIWHMDETSGETVADSSGNGHTGTAVNTTIVDALYDKGRTFNGTSDTVNLGTTAIFSTADVSISLWVKRTSGASDAYLIGTGEDTGNKRDHAVVVTTDGRIIFIFHSENGNIGKSMTTTDANLVPLNTWTHIVVTRVQDVVGDIYINGTKRNSTIACESNGCGSFHGDLPGALGHVGTVSSTGMVGVLDDVRVYFKALSDIEVQQCAGL